MCEYSETSQPETPAEGDRRSAAFCRSMIWLAALAVMLAVAGCQSGWDSPSSDMLKMPPPTRPEADFYSTNRLQEGDIVDINFQYATNFNTLQRIALDGTLNLNTVGPLKAAGKTVVELQQDLARVYQTLAKDDVITVNRMMNSVAIVYVSGAVLKPGPVELDHPLTVIEAVMSAGGFDITRASLSDVSILRIENGEQHAYHVNLKRVLSGKEKTPFYLRPFDIIYVPAKVFNY